MSEIGIEADEFMLPAAVVPLCLFELSFPDLQPLKSTINAMETTIQKRFTLFTPILIIPQIRCKTYVP
ncbi:MAG TPA: hypothetical protein DG942_07705 [Ruminococcaceae bacterium]|nr:hypothetical protein [Oscillospiraceae bacterium]